MREGTGERELRPAHHRTTAHGPQLSESPSGGPFPDPAAAPTLFVPAFLKPRLRGVLHHYSFYVAAVLGVVLVIVAPSPRARIAMSVYALSLAGCLGMSALYHRRDWTPIMRARLGRLDHSMIFVLIAGTDTPFCVLALDGVGATWMLILVWIGAAAGIALTLLWWRAPAIVQVGPYVVLGWVALIAVPELSSALGWTACGLLLGGGALYTGGALIYGMERPDPWPRVFGFHEIFHCLVVAAAGLHLAAIAIFLLPRA
ncbi:MAG: hemolysin III family protein [Candidatus Dormibacteria bacterium]